ncbi:MAG: hypothetical protein ACK55Z_37470 [bacterium]
MDLTHHELAGRRYGSASLTDAGMRFQKPSARLVVRYFCSLAQLVGQFMRLPRREAFRVVLMHERLGIPRIQLKTVYERGCHCEGCSMPILT